MSLYKDFFKPVLDFIVSLIMLLILFPFLIFITIVLMFLNGGKAFFIQSRPGKSTKIFNIIKFQTMAEKKDSAGNLLPDEERITTFGRILRYTSLDELPQLLNVLKGDLSLVGPRPLLVDYLPLYNDFQIRRHEVKPGITGWAQINGRNAITWDEKFKFDVWYVDNLSFILDIKILFRTIKKVFKSEDVNCNNRTTMVRFSGNN
jgi:undecaprenyl phosphate N,N'-diacetylbacillosamine 1-phosphate transferase